MATKNETVDAPQEPTAETGQLDSSELEAVVGGNDPAPPPPPSPDTVDSGVASGALTPPPPPSTSPGTDPS